MRTEKEEKLLKEAEDLILQGVKFSVGDNLCREVKTSFARIEQGFVCVWIAVNENTDNIDKVFSEAQQLLKKQAENKAHEKAHPDFFKALQARIYN